MNKDDDSVGAGISGNIAAGMHGLARGVPADVGINDSGQIAATGTRDGQTHALLLTRVK